MESQRYSNNEKPEFTDQEIMTIYLFTSSQQRYYAIKEIFTFAKEYLLSWFPKLPSYQQFNNRLNKLRGAIQQLFSNLTMLTPHKNVKGESDVIRMKEQASNNLFSKAVSTVFQPIESFFNWINE